MTLRLSDGSGERCEYLARNQLAEPVGQDVAGNPEARLELLEMLEAVERAAKDEERPFLADQLDRGGNRATQRCLAERLDVGARFACSHFADLPAAQQSTEVCAFASCEMQRGKPFALAT